MAKDNRSLWDKLKTNTTRIFDISPEGSRAVRNVFSNRTLFDAFDTAKKSFVGSIRGKFDAEIHKTPEAQSMGRSIVGGQLDLLKQSPAMVLLAGILIIGVLFFVAKRG